MARGVRAGRGVGRRNRSPSRRALRRRTELGRAGDYARENLKRFAQILVHLGYTRQQLLRYFRDICQGLKEPGRALDPTRFSYFADLPHIMSYWYSDPDYLDRRGAPVPLPLSGGSPSLAHLIERVLPGEDPASVADALLHFEAVRRTKGLYLPRQRYLAFSETSARVHGLNAFQGMLRTVEHNVASPKGSGILERSAVNPNYPASLLPLFHRWVKKYAEKWLKSADNYMQVGERSDEKGPRVRLGLSIVAYESPVLNGTLPPPNDAVRDAGAARSARTTRSANRAPRGRGARSERPATGKRRPGGD